MKEGRITWDAGTGRPDIKYYDGSHYGGFHCGDAFDVFIRGDWQPTRIEYQHCTGTWYLIGIEDDEDILGLTVRSYY
jgi:hypothetical protein